jgi:hypothetical protein
MLEMYVSKSVSEPPKKTAADLYLERKNTAGPASKLP